MPIFQSDVYYTKESLVMRGKKNYGIICMASANRIGLLVLGHVWGVINDMLAALMGLLPVYP